MKKIKIIFLVVNVLLLSACAGKKEIAEVKTERNIDKLDYIHLFTEATKHSLLGNYKLAVQLFSKCIEIKPESSAAYYQLSNIYMKAGGIDKAQEFAIQAYNYDSENIWYALHLANLYQYNKNYSGAIDIYENIVYKDSNDEYLYNLALLYSNNNNFEKAIGIIDSVDNSIKNSREIILLRHNIYSKQGKKKEAIDELENLISFFPESPESYGLLAEYLAEIKRNDYAREVYWQLKSKMPGSGLVYISYADFLKGNLNLKDSANYYYQKAITTDDISIDDKVNLIYSFVENHDSNDSTFLSKLFKTFKDNYGNDERIYTVTADYYIKKEKYELARNELESYVTLKNSNEMVWEQFLLLDNYLGNDSILYFNSVTAIGLFPANNRFMLFKAYAEYDLELYDSTISTCTIGLKQTEEKEQKVQYWMLLADAYRGLKNYDLSDSYYEKIIETDPENNMIKNNFAYYLSLRGERLDYAEKLSAETLKAESNNSTYLDTYGWILFKNDKPEEALKYIKSAIENGANENAEVLEHYGDIMLVLDRCKEAIEAWEEALKFTDEGKALIEKIEKLRSTCNE